MYQLMIKAFGSSVSMLFKYDKLDDAINAARRAMKHGFYENTNITIMLGEGSLLNVMSDEAALKADKAEEDAKRSGGLIQSEKYDVKKEDFVLHVQFGMAQLPPLVYRHEKERKAVVDEAIRTRRLEYLFEAEHDYFFIMLGSGVMLISMTGEHYTAQRRQALVMHQRMVAQQAAQAAQQPPKNPKILLPFGK